MTKDAPVIFLAFANARDDRESYLRNLPEEARRLRATLQRAERAGLCEVVMRQNVTLADVLDVFQDAEYRNRIAVFHFGGHANGYQLLLESAGGQPAAARGGGLAAFLGQQRGLQLMFLNGCSTQPQVQGLLEARVGSVIATSRAIDDGVAVDFADRFYRGLAGGAGIRTAYREAEASVQTARENNPRALYYGGKAAETVEGWPWSLNVREGAEATGEWNLPEAAGDPLFGLPDLPARDLPENPFRYLSWFGRDEAEVFFGRGYEIRNLYQRITDGQSAPIILFYGQAGVGKSSVLAAGLLPRLEAGHEVRYMRRDQALGLMGGLRAALGAPGAEQSVREAWRALEARVGKPVVVILDQVEEVYTRHNPDRPEEVDEFLSGLESLVSDPGQRPAGKLILGFREEYLARLEAGLVEHKLARSKVFLERLDRRGVIEAVTGPAREGRLRQQYGLAVEDGLAEIIADDLLADPGSPVAPTLQVLLSKMWDQARKGGEARAAFDRQLYQKLKGEGILLKDFLDQQLAGVRAWRPEVVESGLALDLLAYHTTPLGTAEQRTGEQLAATYRHRAEVLPALLRECQDRYLLAGVADGAGGGEAANRLAHDTLAPLVRLRFEESDRPGQRAWRILESRAEEWAGGQSGNPLDEADLRLVRRGAAGMRSPTSDEQRLIQTSRSAQARRERNRLLLMIAGVAAAVLVVLAAAIAVWQGLEAGAQRDRAVYAQATAEVRRLEAERQAGIAKSRELAAAEERLADKDPELAVLLGLEAVYQTHRLVTDTVTSEALAAVHRAMASSPWRATLRGHGDRVNQAAWSPDGNFLVTASADQTAKVWNPRTGQVLVTLPHTNTVNYAAWGPNGSRLATASADGTAEVWDAQSGQVVFTLPHSGTVNSVVWSPEGGRLLTSSTDQTSRVWDAQAGRLMLTFTHSDTVGTAAWSPDGERVLTASKDGTAKVWDAATGRVELTLLHAGAVNDAAWSLDGSRVTTASDDKTAKVWDAHTGKTLLTVAHDAGVSRAALSPDGSRLATASDDRTARIWDVPTGRELFTLLHDDAVNEATWSLDGSRVATASGDGTARVWDAETGHGLFTLPHSDGVLDAAWSPDGSRLVTTGVDQTAKVWEPSGRPSPFTLVHDGAVWHVAWSPDGNRIVSSSSDRTARVWQTRSGQAVLLFTLPHTGTVKYSAWSPDGNRVATASTDGAARVWDARSGHRLFVLPHGDWVNQATWNPDGNRLVTASADNTAKVWDPWTGELLFTLPHSGTVNYAAWSSDGRRLATASDDRTARVWDAQGGQTVVTLPHTGTVNYVAWSPDGRRVATASSDKVATVWDAQTGDMLSALPHEDAVNQTAWSPDGSLIATASSDGTGRVWDGQNGQTIFTLPHGSVVRHAAWTPDGKRIVTAGTDGIARVWDARGGQLLFSLVHDGALYHAAWSPDGSRLATASTDRAAHLFLAQVEGQGGLSEFACSRTGRNMVAREWIQYMGGSVDYRKTCPGLPIPPT